MALVLSLLIADPLLSAVITVQGGCALAQALHAANTDAPNGGCPAGSGADTIVLTADVALLAVEEVDDGNNGLPTVTSEITIEGNGHTIERSASAVSDFRILKVESTGDLTLKSTTVSGGRATGGGSLERSGGAFFNKGTLTLEHSALVSNLCEQQGGAILNQGSLNSFDSTFRLNLARRTGFQSAGGAISHQTGHLQVERSLFEDNFVGAIGAFPDSGLGGAILMGFDASAVILDSTFTGNNVLAQNASQSGGWAIWGFGGLTLTNSTVSLNGAVSALPGAALDVEAATLTNVTLSGNRGYALSGDFDATATLVADTSDGANCSTSTTITGANNIADDSSCPGVAGTLTGLDPNLEDNGGPTPTHALLAGSNAIDAAGFCALATDQRGAPRVGACDAGAFEFMGCPLLTLADDTVDDVRTFEECAIVGGPNFTVVGPGGDLTLRFGDSTRFANGFSVATDGRLTVEDDPSLLLVLEELIEADRARRARLSPAILTRGRPLDASNPKP